jgi:predicted RNase H-like HicB family nuclease
MIKILIVVEQTATGFSAFSPDVEGCIATGATSYATFVEVAA